MNVSDDERVRELLRAAERRTSDIIDSTSTSTALDVDNYFSSSESYDDDIDLVPIVDSQSTNVPGGPQQSINAPVTTRRNNERSIEPVRIGPNPIINPANGDPPFPRFQDRPFSLNPSRLAGDNWLNTHAARYAEWSNNIIIDFVKTVIGHLPSGQKVENYLETGFEDLVQLSTRNVFNRSDICIPRLLEVTEMNASF